MPSTHQDKIASGLRWVVAGLLLCASAHARAQIDCDRTNDLVVAIDFATDSNSSSDRKKVDDADKTPDRLQLSCLRLQVKRSIENPKFQDRGQWYPFTPGEYKNKPEQINYWNTPIKTFYEDCRKSECAQSGAVRQLLADACKEIEGSDAPCGDPKLKTPLSRNRRIAGGVLIGAGAVALILGAVHMGIPLFATSQGCTAYGLSHPCSADRFGVGGALLGLGLATVGGGVLTLTLP